MPQRCCRAVAIGSRGWDGVSHDTRHLPVMMNGLTRQDAVCIGCDLKSAEIR